MRLLANTIDQDTLTAIGLGGGGPDFGATLRLAKRMAADPGDAAVALALAEDALPRGAPFPPVDRPRLGFPAAGDRPLWVEFSLSEDRDTLAPRVVPRGARMGALLVPKSNGDGGTALAAMALDRHAAVAMPFPATWSGVGRVARLDPADQGFDEAAVMARSALRIVALAVEISRAVEAGNLLVRPGPGFIRESADRARRGRPPLLSCSLLEPAIGTNWEAEGSHRSLGWCAVAGPGGGEIVGAAAGRLTREMADGAAALAEERLALARWSLGRADIGETEAMALQLAEAMSDGEAARSRVAARLVERVGAPVLGLVPRAGGCSIEIIPCGGDHAGEDGRRAAEAWLAGRA